MGQKYHSFLFRRVKRPADCHSLAEGKEGGGALGGDVQILTPRCITSKSRLFVAFFRFAFCIWRCLACPRLALALLRTPQFGKEIAPKVLKSWGALTCEACEG